MYIYYYVYRHYICAHHIFCYMHVFISLYILLNLGYLKKPGNYIHNWKVRYYVLTSTHLHRFQPSQTGKLFGREVGKVKLTDIDHVKHIFTYKTKENCFELVLKHSHGMRVPRILRANTKDEANKWVL